MPAHSLEFIVSLAQHLLVLIFKLTGPSSAVPTETDAQMISSVDPMATRLNPECGYTCALQGQGVISTYTQFKTTFFF